jgi:hypothetical protein
MGEMELGGVEGRDWVPDEELSAEGWPIVEATDVLDPDFAMDNGCSVEFRCDCHSMMESIEWMTQRMMANRKPSLL